MREPTLLAEEVIVRAAVITPDFVPVLSRGRHRRNGARGACFMEFASFLAGERWSDHPKCTHPLLSALARAVNDCTTDEGRTRLVPLIPDVVGLNPSDPRASAVIALHCARTALAVVPADLARVMAVSVLACERYLATLDGLPADHLGARSRLALERQPGALRWARDFIAQVGPVDYRGFDSHAGASTIRQAVTAVRSVTDADDELRAMLAGAIDACRRVDQGGPVELAGPVVTRSYAPVRESSTLRESSSV